MSINEKPIILKNVIASCVFIKKDGKFIVNKRSLKKTYLPGLIQPIGGKLEKDEDPYTAAVREVSEEIGIKIKNLKLEAVVLDIHHRKDNPVNWLVFYFMADYKSGNIHESDEGEVLVLTKKEILASDLFPSLRSIVDTIFSPHDGVIFTTNYYHGFESDMKEISRNVCVQNLT